MLAKLFQRTGSGSDAPEIGTDPEASLPYAAAMLLFEVAWADHDISPDEIQRIDTSLQSLFGVSPGVAKQLAERARIEHVDATSIYPFTREVTGALDADQRYKLMVALWRIALADQALAVYEESAIRSIAELIHVSHRDFIRAKLEAKRLDAA